MVTHVILSSMAEPQGHKWPRKGVMSVPASAAHRLKLEQKELCHGAVTALTQV